MFAAAVASFPDRRQTLTAVMFGGIASHCGLSPFVAVFMKRAQSGTATSAAKPPGRIVRG